MNLPASASTAPVHHWLRQIRAAYSPGATTELLETTAEGILAALRDLGHEVVDTPDNETDILFTTARFGEPIGWRQALLFQARRKFGLEHSPTIYTLIHVTPERFQASLDHFERALEKEPPQPEDFRFEGLAPEAHRVLIEQGQRGGPILALLRQVQSQSKSIRIILIVGDDRPQAAYHFDLVGAYPRSEAGPGFYEDIALRVVTAASTDEVTEHKLLPDPISRETWDSLETVGAMRTAALELDKRKFFTEMVRIGDLVKVPAVEHAVASQYSEGCFATWDSHLEALIATVTGSARPVDKGNITEDDLAVIVGIEPDGSGALVREVQGKRNDPPSSEAVEMMDMDLQLPRITLPGSLGGPAKAPVVRSKLHGHRAIKSFDPEKVEHVPLDPPYYHYPVSCATEAQAQGIKEAFARSEALNDPEDPRQLVFTVLPGHGVMIAEKWIPGKEPFQAIWEAMDSGVLEIEKRIPQGPLTYRKDGGDKMVLEELD